MAKNRLSHLNNHLFAQMERMGDDDLTAEQIDSVPEGFAEVAK